MNSKAIFALFLVHFSGDFFSSFLKPLLPALADKNGLSLAQVGLLSGVSWMLAFLIQPTVGYLADRHQTRFFVLGGPLLTVLFIPLIGVANSFAMLLVLVALGSIGSSMFHPTAAGMVNAHAGPQKSFAMALFQVGGTAAFGVGPLVAGWVVTYYGLSYLPWVSLFGLACMVIVWFVMPVPTSEGLKSNGFIGALREAFGGVYKSVFLVWLLIVLRTFVSQSVITFYPMLMGQAGRTTLDIGGVVSVYTVAGAVSGLIAGKMADRLGYRPVFYISYALTPFCLLGLLHVPAGWDYVLSFASGFVVLATMPLAVSLGQELAPRGRTMVASLTMGLAFGLGGMLAPLTGKLAESFGIVEVLSVITFLPLLGLLLVGKVPDPHKSKA